MARAFRAAEADRAHACLPLGCRRVDLPDCSANCFDDRARAGKYRMERSPLASGEPAPWLSPPAPNEPAQSAPIGLPDRVRRLARGRAEAGIDRVDGRRREAPVGETAAAAGAARWCSTRPGRPGQPSVWRSPRTTRKGCRPPWSRSTRSGPPTGLRSVVVASRPFGPTLVLVRCDPGRAAAGRSGRIRPAGDRGGSAGAVRGSRAGAWFQAHGSRGARWLEGTRRWARWAISITR
jgi:hypothetical protein